MGERRHANAKLDDATWRALLSRWHAGEAAATLRGEAGVSRETWRANAARLGMRLKDLPEGHPARRRAPPHAERPDDWKHPLGALTEGRWRALLSSPCGAAPTLSSPCDDIPPHEGEGGAVVLRAAQRAPGGRWGTWLFLGRRGQGPRLRVLEW